jgi:hypothetical protein
MRQAAEVAPLLGLGRDGVDGAGDVGWLLTGKPSGNAKRLLGLAARHHVLQCVRTADECSELNGAVRDAVEGRVSGPGAGAKRAPVSAANVRLRNAKVQVEQLDVVVALAALQALPPLEKDNAMEAEVGGALEAALEAALPGLAWPYRQLRPVGVLAASSAEAAACGEQLAAMGFPIATLELFLPLETLDDATSSATRGVALFQRVTFVEQRGLGSVQLPLG